MKIRTKKRRCAVCLKRNVDEAGRLPSCAECWGGISTAESITYFRSLELAITAADIPEAIRRAENRALFSLRAGR